MISAMDITTSALVAQRTRLNAISSNLANMSSIRNENGEISPYQARRVVFQVDNDNSTRHGAVGVKVAEVQIENVEPIYRYEPDHPMAIQQGKWKDHVAYPRISMNTEMVDALEAARVYEANVGVFEVTKNLGQQTLRIVG